MNGKQVDLKIKKGIKGRLSGGNAKTTEMTTGVFQSKW